MEQYKRHLFLGDDAISKRTAQRYKIARVDSEEDEVITYNKCITVFRMDH